MVHRITPTASFNEAYGSSASRVNTPFWFELGKARIVGRNYDIAGKRELDAYGVGNTFYSGDDGLSSCAAEPNDIDQFVGAGSISLSLCHAFHPFGHVQSSSEMLPMREENANPEFAVHIQPGHGFGQLLRHRGSVAVIFFRPVQSYQTEMASHLGGD